MQEAVRRLSERINSDKGVEVLKFSKARDHLNVVSQATLLSLEAEFKPNTRNVIWKLIDGKKQNAGQNSGKLTPHRDAAGNFAYLEDGNEFSVTEIAEFFLGQIH